MPSKRASRTLASRILLEILVNRFSSAGSIPKALTTPIPVRVSVTRLERRPSLSRTRKEKPLTARRKTCMDTASKNMKGNTRRVSLALRANSNPRMPTTMTRCTPASVTSAFSPSSKASASVTCLETRSPTGVRLKWLRGRFSMWS